MLVWETKTLMPASLHGWGGRSNGSADLRRPTDLRREDSAERRMCPGPGGCQHVRMPQHRPDSRFAADVDYTGHTGHHDYVVRARHRLLDTTFPVVIDGVEHDPKAEPTAPRPSARPTRTSRDPTAARTPGGRARRISASRSRTGSRRCAAPCAARARTAATRRRR